MPQELEVQVSKLEGSPTAESGETVKVFEYQPPGGEDFPENRGRLFAIVDVKVGAEEDAQLASKMIWDTLVATYYDPSDEPPIKVLESAVSTARERLKNFSEKGTMDLLAVSARDNVIYFSRVGSPTLYLRRGTEVRNLLSGEEAVDIGSKLLEAGDVLIAGSSALGKNFSPKSLPQTQFLVKEFEEGGDIPGLSAFLLRFKASKEAREQAAKEAAPGLPARIAKTVKGAFSLVKGAVSGLKSSPPSPSGVKKAIGGWFEARIERGKRLAASKRDDVKGKVEKEVEKKRARSERGGFPKQIVSNFLSRISLGRVIAVLAVILVASVAFTLWRQAQQARAQEFDHLISQASQNLQEAEGLAGLSNERAKELLDQAENNLENAKNIYPNSEEINPLLAQSQDIFNAIEKITPVTSDHVVYDLNLKVEGARGAHLSGSGSTLYVWEETKGSLFSVKLGERPQAPVLGEGTLSNLKDVEHENGFLYLLSQNALYRVNLSNKEIDEPASFDRFGKAASLDTYLGNIYLLVPEEDQIYKFWNLSGGYASAQRWVEEAVDLGNVVDFAIDGEIWPLRVNGEILRMSKGKRESFSASNLSTPLGRSINIFTQTGIERIYVLDSENNRVVVLEKNGNFVRQFKGEGLDQASDIWVSQDEKRLFILSGSRIFRINL